MIGWGSSFFFPHEVLVRDPRVGGGAGGAWSEPRAEPVPAEVLDEQKLVRTDTGQEVVSSSQVTVPLSADVAVGAKVTTWPGADGEREAKVLAVKREVNPSPLPSFLVLSLA